MADSSTPEGLAYSLTNQAPIDPAVVSSFEEIRGAARPFADALFAVVPPGRARSIAITHLEDAVMWAVKGVAIDQEAALEMRRSG